MEGPSSLFIDSKFECEICLQNDVQFNDILCLACKHKFCKHCLLSYVLNCDNVTNVICPHANKINDTCDTVIDERFIEEVLLEDTDSKETYAQKKLIADELSILNRRHCLTLGCDGYFQTENKAERVALLKCLACGKTNCFKCNCLVEIGEEKQHACLQEKENNASSVTAEPFADLIKSGLLMMCPKCDIPLEKRDSGCDFIRCFYCKLDICFITRQPRWGPNGKGDVSAGCRCGINNIKCHPDCRNCH